MLPSLLEIERYVKVHLDECARFYAVTIIAFLLGFVAGFFTKVNVATVNANTYVLITFSKAFSSCFFEVLLTLVLVNLFCMFFYTSPIAVIVVAVRGILIVRNIVVICTLFGVSGVFFAIFYFAPFHIIFSVVIIVSASSGLRRGLNCRYTRRMWVGSLREVSVLFSASAIVLLVLCLIFSALYVKLVVLL